MKDPNNLILFIILFSTLVFFNPIHAFSTAELESNLNLIENLSKISQIKSIENEIKAKTRQVNDSSNSNNSSNQAGICDTKIEITSDMTVNTDMLIKGQVSAFNIYSKTIQASNEANIKHSLSSDKISSEVITSQSTIVENLSSPTVTNQFNFKLFYYREYLH